MKITKWVECSQEVEVHIGADDIRWALSEAFSRVERDIDDRPNRHDATAALGAIGSFLVGLTDDRIALLKDSQRKIVAEFLAARARRFGGRVS